MQRRSESYSPIPAGRPGSALTRVHVIVVGVGVRVVGGLWKDEAARLPRRARAADPHPRPGPGPGPGPPAHRCRNPPPGRPWRGAVPGRPGRGGGTKRHAPGGRPEKATAEGGSCSVCLLVEITARLQRFFSLIGESACPSTHPRHRLFSRLLSIPLAASAELRRL